MDGFQKLFTLGVFFPDDCIRDDHRHFVSEVLHDLFPKTTVGLWHLLIEDGNSEIDDGKGVPDEGHTIGDSFRHPHFDLLETVLDIVLVLD